jgi:O-antigen ligase
LWVLDILIHQRRIRTLPARPVWPLLGLVVVAGLALGVGQLPWYTFARPAPFGAQLAGLSIFVLSAGAFLLVAYQVHDERWLQAMTWLFLALGAAYIASLLVPGMSVVANLFPYGTTQGSLFWTWLIALAFSQAAFNQRLQPVARAALAALTLAALYVALFINRDWSSGWMPPLASIAVALVVANSRFGLPVVAAGAVGAIAYSEKVAGLVMGGDNAYSMMTRLEAWKIILEIVKVNPILGLGPANYSSYTPLFPILGWSVQFNSHSQYVDLIAQTGLLGLACYLWFFASVAWLGWRLRERVPAGFARAYVCGALGGLAGMLIAGGLGDWILPFFYNVTLGGFRASVLGWLFLGGLIALERMLPSVPKK